MKLLIAIGIVVVATVHGYGAAWLAIWMLFHPYQSGKTARASPSGRRE
jgi:uncharacterized membrane protein YheB (UPF0754 family)